MMPQVVFIGRVVNEKGIYPSCTQQGQGYPRCTPAQESGRVEVINRLAQLL